MGRPPGTRAQRYPTVSGQRRRLLHSDEQNAETASFGISFHVATASSILALNRRQVECDFEFLPVTATSFPALGRCKRALSVDQ